MGTSPSTKGMEKCGVLGSRTESPSYPYNIADSSDNSRNAHTAAESLPTKEEAKARAACSFLFHLDIDFCACDARKYVCD